MVFDALPAIDGLVLFGGCGTGSHCPLNDTWLFDSSGWSNITSEVGPSPEVYWGGATTWEGTNVLAFGGCTDLSCDVQSNATWGLEMNGSCVASGLDSCWSSVSALPGIASSPPPLAGVSMAVDPIEGSSGGAVVLYGGFSQACPTCTRVGSNDTWLFESGAWTKVTALLSGGPYPTQPRWFATMFWDPSTGWLYLYGGLSGAAPGGLNELWATDTLVWINESSLVTPTNGAEESAVAAGALNGSGSPLPPIITCGVNDSGQTVSTTWVFENGLLPQSTVSDSTPETNETVFFFSNTTGGDRPMASWSFGDASSTSAGNASHEYSAVGTYDAVLSVTDAVGVQAVQQLQIVVSSFSVSISVPPYIDALDATTFSVDARGGIAPYNASWDFADIGSLHGTTVHPQFPGPGQYSAFVTVEDSTGTVVEASVDFAVASQLHALASAAPSAIDVGNGLTFSGLATGGISPYNYSWTLPDGRIVYGINASYVPETVGPTEAALTVVDLSGSTAESILNVSVAPPLAGNVSVNLPQAYQTTLAYLSVELSGGTTPLRIAWEFGDGQWSSSQNVTHDFPGAGTYVVNLWVNDSGGDTFHDEFAVKIPRSSAGLLWKLEALPLLEQLGIVCGVVVGISLLVFLFVRHVRRVEPPKDDRERNTPSDTWPGRP